MLAGKLAKATRIASDGLHGLSTPHLVLCTDPIIPTRLMFRRVAKLAIHLALLLSTFAGGHCWIPVPNVRLGDTEMMLLPLLWRQKETTVIGVIRTFLGGGLMVNNEKGWL